MKTKTKSAHTPGPWHIRSKSDTDHPNKYNLRVTADCEGGEVVVAEDIGYDTDPQSNADAQLIAAAPDLLKAQQACERIFSAWRKDADPDGDLTHGESAELDAANENLALVRAAITKATSEHSQVASAGLEGK